MPEFVFWQQIVSPHMFFLAESLRGCKVTYVAAQPMSVERVQLGWQVPDTTCIQVRYIENVAHVASLISGFSEDTIHLTEGVRASGYVSTTVIPALCNRHARWGAIMETIDERYGLAPLKRLIYRIRFARNYMCPDFLLAIGERMPAWLAARGFLSERVFPFAYFLRNCTTAFQPVEPRSTPFQVGFVGQLIHRKRLDLLIDALSGLLDHEFELLVAGTGPLEARLQRRAAEMLGCERVRMLGVLPMNEIRALMASLDCLVLPSDHDGWGAVVSEALMSGVPVICSDACGAATAVRSSGVGGVFPRGRVEVLRDLLHQRLSVGRLSTSEKATLADWANCLGAESGARYLKEIIESVYGDGGRPAPPWEKRRT